MSEKKKYAHYELNGSSLDWLMEVIDSREEDDDWLRTSEIVEIEEPAQLPASVLNPKKILKIEEEMERQREDHTRRMATLEEQRQKLLAIEYQPADGELPDLDPEGTLKAQDDLSAEGERV